jgi:predicted ferric reductase
VPLPSVRSLTSVGTVRRRSPGPAAARRAPRSLLTIVVVGALPTTWMWWRDMSPPRGIGDWLSDGGRLTGLLGGYGLGVLLLLMSRVPWLERRIGAGELAGWHARGGRYVLILLVAHTLLIIWGYAASTRTTLTSETTTLLAHYADVLAATVALGLLLGVWLASASAIRRRLRYETWFYLHLYTYLAAALAFAHEFATGADFATHPLARLIWALFYVTVAAALAWYRFCVPARGAFRHRLRITRVRHETPVVTTLFVGGRRVEELRAEPGQFFRWRFLTREGWWQSHPFSLSAAPNGSSLRISIKDSGDFTHRIGELRPGTRVLADGPFGTFTEVRRTHQRVALIAGGIGITPLRALFEALPAERGDLALIYRVLRDEDLVLRDELERIAAERGADLFLIVGDHRHPEHHDRLAPGRLREMVPDLPSRDVYLCGPAQMMDEVKRSLREAGVPRRQIHTERFALAL